MFRKRVDQDAPYNMSAPGGQENEHGKAEGFLFSDLHKVSLQLLKPGILINNMIARLLFPSLAGALFS